MMVTIAWNPVGFHLLEVLPKSNTFNAEYYSVNILTELLHLRQQVDGRRFAIYADNASPTPSENAKLLRRQSAPPRRTPTVLT
jgi:hypothetical protein